MSNVSVPARHVGPTHTGQVLLAAATGSGAGVAVVALSLLVLRSVVAGERRVR